MGISTMTRKGITTLEEMVTVIETEIQSDVSSEEEVEQKESV